MRHASFEEYEIGAGWRESHLELAEKPEPLLALLFDLPRNPARISGILQACGCRSDGQAVEEVRIVEPLGPQRPGDPSRHQTITDIKPREAIDLGKGPKDNHVFVPAHEICERAFLIAPRKLQVRLIDDAQR